jgi:hypothetical protein
MKTNLSIQEIRRLNTIQAVAHILRKSEQAELLGIEPSQLSQLLGKNPFRKIGEQLARQFEQRLGKPAMWLDHPHTQLMDAMEALEIKQPELHDLTEQLLTAIQTDQVGDDSIRLLKENIRFVINQNRAAYHVEKITNRS